MAGARLEGNKHSLNEAGLRHTWNEARLYTPSLDKAGRDTMNR